MKKKLLSKVLALALAATTVLATAACGSAESGQSQESSKASEESKTSEAAPESSAAPSESEETGEITYPLENAEKLTLWTSRMKTDNSIAGIFIDGLKEHTGVDVEWQFPLPGSDAGQAYNLMLTEEELPNIIFDWNNNPDLLIEDGVIYDLTEYIPKYAPDYYELITSDPAIYASVTTTKGKLWGFYNILESDYNMTYTGPVIRQDWLDECGLEAPVTMEEWENVLVTFKEKYNATFGFTKGYMNDASIGTGVGAYGTFGLKWYVDDNGDVQLAQEQPEWKEYMSVLNKWYNMGLIDKDSFSMDNTAMRAKVLNNEIGVAYTAMSQLSLWSQDAEAENTGADWVGFSYPRTAEGEPTCIIPGNAQVKGFQAVITTSCSEEELITALKLLNYGYTEEGMMYWNFGTEGVSYTLNADGEPEWTDLVLNDPDGMTQGMEKYSGTSGIGISVQMARLVQLKNVEAAANAVWEWIDNTDAAKHRLAGTAYTIDEETTYNDKYAALSTHINEYALKFVVGEESLDNFDAFIEELNALGLQEVKAIQQAAYERFMSK